MELYQQLEEGFGRFAGYPASRTVCCSSGTASLHLALETFRLPPGSLVAVPDFTMIACARAVTLAGLEPVFVGCTDRLLIDRELLEQAMRDYPIRAVMPVHIYGRAVSMDEVHAMARWCGAFVVEDLAEAHGLPPHPRTDAACYSFFRNKIISGAEGGATCFRSQEHADLARQLRCLGFTEAHDFDHVARGHNYRMSNLHAEPILESLKEYPDNLVRRRMIEGLYDERCPAEWRMPYRDAPWVYDVRLPEIGKPRLDIIIAALNREGIAARHFFKPMHLQREYQHCPYIGVDRGEHLHERGLYLPLCPSSVRLSDVAKSFDVLRSFAEVSRLLA